MRKYDAQKARARFEKRLNKCARRLSKADEKGREFSIIFLRCKIASLANKRSREIEKYETKGASVKPEVILDKEYIVNFKVRADLEKLSQEESNKILGYDANYKIFQTVQTSDEKPAKNKDSAKSL